MAAMETRFAIRDISVRLFRTGAGEKLVFLHGAGGVPPWTAFFETLAGRFDVLVPEHPGFGTSDNPPWIRNVADLAMYYLDFFDALGGEKVHLVGNSLGGWVAAELAVRNTAKLRSLSLLAPAGIRVKGMPAGDNFIWTPEETARNLFHDQAMAERVLAMVPSDAEADILLTNRFAAAKFGWEPRWFNPALERWLHRIDVPTLVLWGEGDKLFPSAYAQRWGERVPGAAVEIIKDCGHLPHIEKAESTAQSVLRFIERSAP
jgi:pimeloyl-ACP methyl ester carboxylesterase